MRSAAKPFQALPLARDGELLDDRDLAIAWASHLADAGSSRRSGAPCQIAGTEDDLECGPDQGSKLKHNCSGKHAGMLALCTRRAGLPGYRRAEHPSSSDAGRDRRAAGTGDFPTAVDGCGVVTFALSLDPIALAFARLDERIVAAMRAYPELIRGPALWTRISCRRYRGGPPREAPRGSSAQRLPRAWCGAESRGRHAPCATAGGRVVSRPGRAGVRTRSGHEQPGRGCRGGN